MFAKIAVPFVYITALAAGVMAAPTARAPVSIAKRSDHSFNNWQGHQSLNNFDNFYGADNFDGSRNQVTLIEENKLVCRVQQVEIVQQRLVVLQELAKKIITETICEVESQTIVFEQWHSGLRGFGRDLRRQSGRQPGYDREIAGHFNKIYNDDGNFNFDNWGFSGRDVGKNHVTVGGSNWDDSRSFTSVNEAYRASRDAYNSIH